MDKISVIIPVYNVEPYIRKCLDSVINQTHTNLEIILIDDGSTDNSGKICDEYAKKDSRIRVFHKQNGGLSSALSVGLKHFTGDCLGFADPDDWLESDMYEILYKALTEHGVSLSAVNYFMDYDGCCEIVKPREEIAADKILTQEKLLLYAVRAIHYEGFGVVVWNKLFKAEVILKNGLAFDENNRAGVTIDTRFTLSFILTDGCTGVFRNIPLYHYYQRVSSIMHTNHDKNTLDALSAYKEIISMIEAKGFGDAAIWYKREHCYRASLLAEEAVKNRDANLLAAMQAEMGVYLKEYIKTNSEFPKRIERINKLLTGKCS